MRGSLYRRGKIWWMAYMVDGRQRCESSGTTNKRVAQKILNMRLAEIIEGRFRLPKTNPPKLEQFSEEFLGSVRHQNTKKRYASNDYKRRTNDGFVRPRIKDHYRWLSIDLHLNQHQPECSAEFKGNLHTILGTRKCSQTNGNCECEDQRASGSRLQVNRLPTSLWPRREAAHNAGGVLMRCLSSSTMKSM
jgi:hypothetical protein